MTKNTVKPGRMFGYLLLFIVGLAVISFISNKAAGPHKATEPTPTAPVAKDGKSLPVPTSPNTAVQEKKWYEGGTLHKATALEWQNASYDNKMATCADFFSALYAGKNFKQTIQSSIKSTDDMVPYVEKLVADMDIALSKESDTKKNKVMYSNQRVSESAAMLMVMNGWTKPK